MARPDGRLEPGQPLRGAISARAWNRAQDAADLVLGANPGTEGVPGSPVLKPYTWVYCKPSVTVARWGVLAITGMEITPTSSSGGATASFEEMPVLTGGTPSATTTAWCVTVEPIESGKIGRVAVGGVVQCKVEVDKADDKFAACKASAAELKTGTSGEGLILWKESGTGTGKWALVRLAAGGAQGIKRGTFSAPWTKGSTKTVSDAVNSGTTYDNVQNYFASLTGSGTKACAIAYVGSEWILIAAECG
jgi:hypothetical protein